MAALLLMPSQSSPSLKETHHLLALSLPPGRDSQQIPLGVGRSSSRHSPSCFSEAGGQCACPGARGGEEEGQEKGVHHHAGSPGSLPGAGLALTSQRLRRKGEALLTRAPS